MAKVSITIDDKDPDLVAAFGDNALEKVAEFHGWQAEVPKDESELPEKVEKQPTQDDIDMGITEPYMAYPDGTELKKPNPQSAATFVADFILRNDITKRLLKSVETRVRKEKEAEVETALKSARSVVINKAKVDIVE